MEAIIWQHDSIDGADHGQSCAAFASLTLELAAQVVGQQSWVSGGGSYPWPLHSWADVRVEPNPDSLAIISIQQDAEAQNRWHPLGDGYRPLPGDWVLFHGHVEVITEHSGGLLRTVGGDSLPNFSVNAHEYRGPLSGAGVVGFVNNGSRPAVQGSARPDVSPSGSPGGPPPGDQGGSPQRARTVRTQQARAGRPPGARARRRAGVRGPRPPPAGAGPGSPTSPGPVPPRRRTRGPGRRGTGRQRTGRRGTGSRGPGTRGTGRRPTGRRPAGRAGTRPFLAWPCPRRGLAPRRTRRRVRRQRPRRGQRQRRRPRARRQRAGALEARMRPSARPRRQKPAPLGVMRPSPGWTSPLT